MALDSDCAEASRGAHAAAISRRRPTVSREGVTGWSSNRQTRSSYRAFGMKARKETRNASLTRIIGVSAV
jgi:hypothetical protein